MTGVTGTLNKDSVEANNGLDAIVIQEDLADVPGGATLDCSADAVKDLGVIKAGHVIVKDASTGALKPLAPSGTGYGSIGSDTAVGVLKHSILVAHPFAAILTIGQVNKAACPYTVSSTIESALPHIKFI